MSTSEHESGSGIEIDDDQLPDELVPHEDNPLAEPLDDGESVDDLLEDGKPAEGEPSGEGLGATEG